MQNEINVEVVLQKTKELKFEKIGICKFQIVPRVDDLFMIENNYYKVRMVILNPSIDYFKDCVAVISAEFVPNHVLYDLGLSTKK